MRFLRSLWSYLWPALVWWLTVLVCLLWAVRSWAAPQDAVVRIISHGGSGTIIYTAAGRTLILSCGHLFADEYGRRSPALVAKQIVVDAPSPSSGAVVRPGIRLLAVDYKLDLSLIEMRTGPLPYCVPVVPVCPAPGPCLSVGYDEMRLPQTVRQATLIGSDQARAYTRERPWHGRSGGMLLDQRSESLIGVVHGYECRNGNTPQVGDRGLYVSHTAIVGFLRSQGFGAPSSAVQTPAPVADRVPGRPWVSESLDEVSPPGRPWVSDGREPISPLSDCPGGQCPNGQCPLPSARQPFYPPGGLLRPGGT